jgi:hypothetical protein
MYNAVRSDSSVTLETRNCSLARTFQQEHMEVRSHRLGTKLPHHQCDLTTTVSGMVCQMLHQMRQCDLCCAKRDEFAQSSFVKRFTNSVCSFSQGMHLDEVVVRAHDRAGKPAILEIQVKLLGSL